ncbi:unnamed protein product [Calicophoron daubneyi]|uniref:Methyltransferase type 11 domain-containing protein n=1 Tax=Calicophoron daubneyi TaxID=300641 RepID=A0AAV2TDN4_CALDB
MVNRIETVVIFRRLISLAPSSPTKNLMSVHPLAHGEPVRVPPALSKDAIERCSLLASDVWKVSVARRPQRRVENKYGNRANLISGSFARMHSTREYIQYALYKFALYDCLGLSISHRFRLPQGSLVFDLGAGQSHAGALLIDRLLKHLPLFTLGIDVFFCDDDSIVPVSSQMNRIISDLSTTKSLIPLRSACADVIVSVSFLQWLFVEPANAPLLVRRFVSELSRLLIAPQNTHSGQCVIQFYPSSGWDLDLLGQSLANAQPKLTGCCILSRPLENRGVKVFFYVTRTE